MPCCSLSRIDFVVHWAVVVMAGLGSSWCLLDESRWFSRRVGPETGPGAGANQITRSPRCLGEPGPVRYRLATSPIVESRFRRSPVRVDLPSYGCQHRNPFFPPCLLPRLLCTSLPLPRYARPHAHFHPHLSLATSSHSCHSTAIRSCGLHRSR
jgi:hypothetical protein